MAAIMKQGQNKDECKNFFQYFCLAEHLNDNKFDFLKLESFCQSYPCGFCHDCVFIT